MSTVYTLPCRRDLFIPMKTIEAIESAFAEVHDVLDTVSAGAEGPAGPPGADGAPGPPGADGAAGAPGSTGATGPAGETGAAGIQGLQGIQGIQGPAGPPGEGGAVAWGGVTGTLSDQTDLQAALDTKAASAHTHPGVYEPANANLQAHVVSAHAPSTAQANADITKAEIEAKLTGAITSHTHAKADVGLGNVDNTTDAGKPVSTATQTALNLKANAATPTFTGATLTLADAQDIVIGATTGTKIGQATSKIGFFGVTPVVRPTALTQTYSTASATHAAVTQLAAPAGGTGVAAGGWSSAANRDLAITSINAARTDIANLKNFVNQIVDQLQALGLLQ